MVTEVETADGTAQDIGPTAPSCAFVGVNVQPGHMMIDTGAQLAIIGQPAFEDLCSFCRENGYEEPVWIHHNMSYTKGIGGPAKVIGEAKVPIGMGGAPGSMTMRVMEDKQSSLKQSSLKRSGSSSVHGDFHFGIFISEWDFGAQLF